MANDIRNRWAFLVGVNYYREHRRFGRLHHCVKDVLALEALLKQVGFGVICLHDELDDNSDRFPNTANTIKAELRKLQDKIGPDDLLLVYVACHGTRSLTANDTRPHLILRETRPTLPETALAVADLKAEMQALKAERQILLLDACHMGMGKDERGDDTEAARQFIRNVHELATGFALLTPSTAQQTTKESDELQHGVFSNFVLSGLRGEGEALVSPMEAEKQFVTVGSLSKYVSNKMLIWAAEKGYEQLPQGHSEGGLGNFIVVDYRQQALPEPPADVPNATAGLDVPRSVATVSGEELANNENISPAASVNWDNSQARKLLRKALLSVYPDRTDLAMFLEEELGKKLNEIALTGNLTNDAFKLVQTAHARGWINRLYESFCLCNANNSAISTLLQQLEDLT